MANNPVNLKESRFINQVCSNTKTDFIEITEDKLENILIKFLEIFKKTLSWITPFSIFLTILITLLTTEFQKNFLGIDKTVWSSVFYISIILSVFWLIYDLYNIVKFRKKRSVEYLIKIIKNN
jgi:hypothetical protein